MAEGTDWAEEELTPAKANKARTRKRPKGMLLFAEDILGEEES